MDAFTPEHFKRYAELVVFDDGSQRGLEGWQLELAADLFKGYKRNLWIIPEGNGKSTLVALLALYGADYSESPWIPVAAASAKQARIVFAQAAGFIYRTPGMRERFLPQGGYIKIRSLRNGGEGIDIMAHDPKTGDGVIPYPFALLDEMHRHPDMTLWELWAGKLRKRGAQILGISTAGEPETPFENLRDAVRRRARKRDYDGYHLRAEAPGEILHEWMVPQDELCDDMAAVKAANPLSTITEAKLAEDYALVNDLADWKRLKCNRPVRSALTAISDREWDDAETTRTIPDGADVDVGIDVAFKWDTTALVPLYKDGDLYVLGETTILTPPRDHSSMHPDVIKDAFLELRERFNIQTVVMDMHRAEDIAAWIEDLGITVAEADHAKTKVHVSNYNTFMDLLRNGKLKHTGDDGLRSHVLNAIARRLPGGDYRFDRPSEQRGSARMQDRRVIDALSAAAMVVEFGVRSVPKRSVYEDRFISA